MGSKGKARFWVSGRCVHLPLCPLFVGGAHYTLHPTPYTPTTFTLHPTPYTLHPTPYTPHPAPFTPHPTPYTLHPNPSYTLSLNSKP